MPALFHIVLRHLRTVARRGAQIGSRQGAGFGIGFERLIMYLTGISNIRDVLPFPRTTGTAEF